MDFRRSQLAIGDFRFETENGGRIPRCPLRRAIGYQQFAIRIRDAARGDLFRIREIFLHDSAQLHFIAIAQEIAAVPH